MPASPNSTDLTADTIRSHLRTRVVGCSLHVLDETPSTNSAASALAQEGAPDGTVVVADSQTAGRGRLGRPWFSPPGCNLYCSIILRRPCDAQALPAWLAWIPLTAGMAAVRTIRRTSLLRPMLKWPNDLLLNDRKIGGVLCERVGSRGSDPCVVVGIGINVNADLHSFPSELRAQVASLASEAAQRFDRGMLLAILLGELEHVWNELAAGPDEALTREYTGLCSTLGRVVEVQLAEGSRLQGRAVSISADGSLQLVPDSPEPESSGTSPVLVRAGDVLHVR